MSENIDLKELRRKAMSSFHEDGIIDIILGILALIWGFSAFTDDQSLSVIWIAVVIPSYWWLKREYTMPRIGMVRFSRNTKSATTALAAGAVGALIAVGIVIWWTSLRSNQPFYYVLISDNWALTLGLCSAALGVVYARVALLPRFYAYAAITLLFVGSAQFLRLPFGVHLIALGAVFLGYGGYLLYRFTRKYHVQAVDGQVG
jgi:hypothetical protein